MQHTFGVVDPRPYTAYAAARGSLAVLIHADDATMLANVIQRYERLVRATQETDDLPQVLTETPIPVVRAYHKHLRALDNQHAEVLTQWTGGSVFLGTGTAEDGLEAYPTTDMSPTRIATVLHRGNFEGFWPVGRRWRFGFYDTDANESFVGKIGKDIKKEWARNIARDPVLVGSPNRRYEIQVLTTFDAADEPLERTLVNFTQLATE
jgi:hypothetical protein